MITWGKNAGAILVNRARPFTVAVIVVLTLCLSPQAAHGDSGSGPLYGPFAIAFWVNGAASMLVFVPAELKLGWMSPIWAQFQIALGGTSMLLSSIGGAMVWAYDPDQAKWAAPVTFSSLAVCAWFVVHSVLSFKRWRPRRRDRSEQRADFSAAFLPTAGGGVATLGGSW